MKAVIDAIVGILMLLGIGTVSLSLYKTVQKVALNTDDKKIFKGPAFLPTLILLFPVHFGALIIFVIFDMIINVMGYLGYELYPSGSTQHWLGGLLNTSTHHNMHHRYFSSNFGLYFNSWDSICWTNHAQYHEAFESVAKCLVISNKNQ